MSRGIEAESLEGRWKHGPEFLYRPESEWPQDMNDANERINEEETVKFLEYRKSVAVNITIKSPEKSATTKPVGKLIDCKKFSSWRKLLGVACYVLLFIKKFQAKHSVKNNQEICNETSCCSITPQALNEAEILWILEAQQELHVKYKKGEYSKLSPFVDKDGVIRVGGRIDTNIVS